MVTASLRLFLYVREFARGLRRIKCRSTHLSIVKTESVDGKRLSAAVLMMVDDAILKVAAIPLSAC